MPAKRNSRDDGDLPGSLEEFGLSKYEARAYLTMIGKGSLAASEIAYYSNLPRTKIYQTLKKLEKKRLAVVSSKQKPLICSAIPPEEAFAELVGLHERRVKNMKKMVEHLQRLNDEGQRPKGSEERRYFILDANSALEKIQTLIAHSRSSLLATLDEWGLRLLTQCKSSLIKALTNGCKIRLVVGAQCIGNEGMFSIPEAADMRLSGSGVALANLMVIDSTHMVSIDSSNGKAALFSAQDSFGAFQSKSFESEWSRATELKHMGESDPAVAARAVELARALENGLSSRMLEYALSAGSAEMPAGLVDLIDEKYGMKLGSMTAPEVMNLVDSALRISCLGGLKHDKANNILSLQSKVESKHALPWALVLASYFTRSGNDARILQQGGKGLQLVHLRLSKPLST
ncbi:MAG TPA: helix-turn-helix domain-containing protein [Nitrososphaera sp.]|nr:helix-turn-helix domain-containing protein [Nitrososphaera sp.]